MEAATAASVSQETTLEGIESSGLSETQIKILRALSGMRSNRYVDIESLKQKTGCLGGHLGRALTGLADHDLIVRRHDSFHKRTFYSIPLSRTAPAKSEPEEDEHDDDDDGILSESMNGSGVTSIADLHKQLMKDAKRHGWTVEILEASKKFEEIGVVKFVYHANATKVAS